MRTMDFPWPKGPPYAIFHQSRIEITNVQIFKRWSGCMIMKENVPGWYVLAPCIASILKCDARAPLPHFGG